MKATVAEVKLAFRAFRRIGEESRLPQKAAWRVSRLTGQLRNVLRDAEETERRLILDAGGVSVGNSAQLLPVEREKDESDADWKRRLDEHNKKARDLQDAITANDKEVVEVNYDPIPLSFFKDDEKTPAEKRRQFSFNDLADAGPFIVEDEEKKPE